MEENVRWWRTWSGVRTGNGEEFCGVLVYGILKYLLNFLRIPVIKGGDRRMWDNVENNAFSSWNYSVGVGQRDQLFVISRYPRCGQGCL